jgi:uncharacterized membrane protein
MTTHVERNNIIAAIAYVFFFVPYFTSSRQNSFVLHHSSQGTGLFLTAAALRGIGEAIAGPPYFRYSWFGSLTSQISSYYLDLACAGLVLLMVIGMTNAIRGNTKSLPIIGQYLNSLGL